MRQNGWSFPSLTALSSESLSRTRVRDGDRLALRKRVKARSCSAQCHVVRRQQRRGMFARQKGELVLALGGQGVEADKRFVDESGMAHHDAALGKPVEKVAHQRAEIGLAREIIGAGKAGIEGDILACGALTKLRAERIQPQLLGGAKPL